jgi:hypothetical protein
VRDRDGKGGYCLHRAFDERVVSQHAFRRGRCRKRLGGSFERAGDGRHTTAEQETLGNRTGQIGDLTIERAGGPSTQRTRRSSETIHDDAAVDGERGCKRATYFEQDERCFPNSAPVPTGVFRDRECGRAHFVRGPHVDAIDFPMDGNGLKVNHSRREHDWNRRLCERPHEFAETANAAVLDAALVSGCQKRQAEIAFRNLANGCQRQAVA